MVFPLMQKATAVWLVDNTSLTFKQIAEFCGLHELEVNGIADGEVAGGIRGMDPVANNQLSSEEIKRCEKDVDAKLILMVNPAAAGEGKRRGPRYTPLSKRQDRPAAIAWLVKYHPEMSDAQISKLIGTTKPTIQTIRQRTHWNIGNIQPLDPVALGLCKQIEMDSVIKKLNKNSNIKETHANNEEDTSKLISLEESLNSEKDLISDEEKSKKSTQDIVDPESLFNLPKENN
mgnify:CR=1 FL=1